MLSERRENVSSLSLSLFIRSLFSSHQYVNRKQNENERIRRPAIMMIMREKQFKFKSDSEIPLHFLCSSVQLVSILAILGFQIVLTITNTCPFSTAIGYWSFPFLIIAPISIGIFLQKRNFLSCYLLIATHFCSNVFATVIIIISVLVLIQSFGSSCLIMTEYSLALNISLVTVSICLKIVLYGEILHVYVIARRNRKRSKASQRIHHMLFDDPYRRNWKLLQFDFRTFDEIDI